MLGQTHLLQDTYRICSFWFKWCPTSHMTHQATWINGWLTRSRQTLPGNLLRSTEHARTNTLVARYLWDLLFLIQKVSHSISSGASRGRRNGRSPLNNSQYPVLGFASCSRPAAHSLTVSQSHSLTVSQSHSLTVSDPPYALYLIN
jgi:hypothetical protein